MPLRFQLDNAYRSLPALSVEAPRLMVITGVNGSGKSHFLDAIAKRAMRVTDGGKELESIRHFSNVLSNPFQMRLTTESVEKEAANQFGHLQRRRAMTPEQLAEADEKNPRHGAMLDGLAELAGKPLGQLTHDDFRAHWLALSTDIAAASNPFQINPAAIIHAHRQRRLMNDWAEFRSTKYGEDTGHLSESDFVTKYGPPPSDLMERVAQSAGLGLEFGELGIDNDLHLRFITADGVAIEAGDLSSGERLLVGLSAALYNFESEVPFPKLILFDEVDAALHPGWIRRFFDGLQRVFVDGAGAAVVLVTHSPSVAALCPEESLFMMTRADRRPVHVPKDIAIGSLTAGVPSLRINYENRCQVFVESKFDEDIYTRLYEHVRDELEPEIGLSFIATGHEKDGGCARVKEVVRKLRGAGNEQIFGLVDRDSGSGGGVPDGIFQVGGTERYSIENFILDPLLVGVLLVDLEPGKYAERVGVRSVAAASELTTSTAQSVVDRVLQLVCESAWPSELSTEAREVEYLGGARAVLEARWLELGQHKLAPLVRGSFHEIERLRHARADKNTDWAMCVRVVDSVLRAAPNLVPKAVVTTLREIQTAALPGSGGA